MVQTLSSLRRFMLQIRKGRLGALCTLGMLAGGPSPAGDFYVGGTLAAERTGLFYSKAVHGSSPVDGTPRVWSNEVSTSGLGIEYGPLAGYRLNLGGGGTFLAVEGDFLRHARSLEGHLAGAGASEGRNQLGESWPEDWTLSKESSLGATARFGIGLPTGGPRVGTSLYGLAGMRRLTFGFTALSSGCLRREPCTQPGDLSPGESDLGRSVTGWTAGGGIEQGFGSLAFRGEIRLNRFPLADQVVHFNEYMISVPLQLDVDSVSLGLTVVWYF